MQDLNALFGVAYGRSTLNPDPQLGNFWATEFEDKNGWRSTSHFVVASLCRCFHLTARNELARKRCEIYEPHIRSQISF